MNQIWIQLSDPALRRMPILLPNNATNYIHAVKVGGPIASAGRCSYLWWRGQEVRISSVQGLGLERSQRFGLVLVLGPIDLVHVEQPGVFGANVWHH